MNLPEYLARWDLRNPRPLAATNTAELFLVDRRAGPAVLKVLTEAGRRDEARSASVLRYYGGEGAVELFAADSGALLMAAAGPRFLKDLSAHGEDERATEILASLLPKLHRARGAPAPELPSLAQYYRSLFVRAAHPGADPLFGRAARVAEGLLATEENRVVLHGDIHHTNVLEEARGAWVVIDPKGIYGEDLFDYGNAFFNPDDNPALVEQAARLRAMAQTFARGGRDPQRLLRWALTFGALSAAWCYEDGHNPSRRERITKLLETLL